MPCLNPTPFYLPLLPDSEGKRKLKTAYSECTTLQKIHDDLLLLTPPGYKLIYNKCRYCAPCCNSSAAEWTERMIHELSTTKGESYLITFTYDDEHLPHNGYTVTNNKEHPPKIFKALRQKFGSFRYYNCNEYGTINGRPHFHTCAFGLNGITDLVIRNKKQSGHHKGAITGTQQANPLATKREKIIDYQISYTSQMLTKLWGNGNVDIVKLNAGCCGYVAKYVISKNEAKIVAAEYGQSEVFKNINLYSLDIDKQTGEIKNKFALPRKSRSKKLKPLYVYQEPVYVTMSTNPGIGSDWYDKFGHTDLHQANDYLLTAKGRKPKIPVYYDRKLEQNNKELYDDIKAQRALLTEFPDFKEIIRLRKYHAHILKTNKQRHSI